MRKMRGTHRQKASLVEAFFMEINMKKIWIIKNTSDLFKCLNSNENDISKALSQKDKYYTNVISIPKKNGYRSICVIDKSCAMYRLQKRLKTNFLDNIMVSDLAYGFKRNYDYFDFLKVHKNFYGINNYLRIDISNFFGTINANMVRDTLDYYIDCDTEEEKERVLSILLELILYNGELIQGTPIAPVISNIIFRPMDIRIERYCERQNVIYSRYADDLLFSSEKKNILKKNFLHTIERILSSNGFSINYDKLRRSEKSIALNGFIIDKDVRLSRKKLKPINRVLFYLETKRYENATNWIKDYNTEISKYNAEKNLVIKDGNDLINILAGYRAFIINSIKHSNDKDFISRANRMVKRIEKQIIIITKECEKKSI